MKPIYVRELKELSPAFALALACAVVAGTEFTGPLSRQLDDMLAMAAAGGFVIGLVQGVLDRWRRADLFALHRPVPAASMEAARTLAGATAVLLALAALVVAHRQATLAELADLARRPRFVVFGEPPEHLGAAEVAFLGCLLLATWAVARFAVGAVRMRWAIPALIVLPFAMWSLLSHAATLFAATGFALLLAALFAWGSGLCLAGDRR